MPSTTVHIPDDLLSRIDQVVKEENISRNRFIIQACEQALNSYAGVWPENFFNSELDKESLKLLEESVSEMEHNIMSRRKSRTRLNICDLS
jgi:metal-responsive CopG/Arc/MetJ family transcriptional regulator